LEVGKTYSAKKPRKLIFGNDNRTIVWMSLDYVQYDSDTVKLGRKLPTVTREQFLKWAKEEVHEDA
jgi:hypothetical protein